MALLTALVVGSGAPAGSAGPASAHAALSRPPTASAAPDPVGGVEAARAAETARRTGVPVEIVGERTETARVFANPSGTRTLEQYVLPVRAQRDGRWVPIDTRLVRDAAGGVSPGATPIGLRLSGGGSGPLVTAEQDGAELGLTWPAPLPAPVLDGDTATYPEVLPGVDLQVRVNGVGFSQFLVVKNAAAAANPALRRIRFGTSTRKLTLRAGADGGSTAVDATGRAVFASGPPVMWDSTPEPPEATGATLRIAPDAESGRGEEARPAPGRQRVMDLEVNPGELVVVPDQKMLTAPDTRYPVYIDPSYSAAQYRWTLVNKDAAGKSYWTDDFYREDVRVGTVYDSGDGPWRTFFQMNIARVARATVSRAWFSISMTHTANCAESSVELWHTRPIDPAVGVTWNNSAGNWLGGAALATRDGKANKSRCGQPPMLMEFGLTPDTVTPVVQEAVRGVNGPQEAIGFGLKIPDDHEGKELYWKRFNPATARLNIEYNTPPESPTSVSTVPPTPCGTAAAPTALNTATPTFTAVGYDPNSDNVTNELEILSGETVLTSLSSGTVGSGSVVRWPPVPAGTLPTDQPGAVFSYRARTRDSGPPGGYGERCWFTVDASRPLPPTLTSTDYPGPTPVKAVGEVGTVTFAPSGAETDVAGYRYGFSQDVTTMWVAAGADGRATVPVTLWPQFATDTGDVRRTLWARAVDRAGNNSGLSSGRELVARGRTVSDPAVSADVNGDRRGDVTALVDHGHGQTAVWNLLSAPGGFHPGYVAWDTGISGGFPAELVRSVTGDFDGNGRTDVAIFREDADRMVRLFLLPADGNRFSAVSEPVWTGDIFRLSHLKVVAGDFDADGDDDIAALQGLAGGQLKLWAYLSTGNGFAAPALSWDSGATGAGVAGANLVAADVDGDGDDDVVDMHDMGNAQTHMRIHHATAGVFGGPVTRWDSGVGAFDARRARFVAGDVDGDALRRAEVVALYDDGNATARLVTWKGDGTVWTPTTRWSSGVGGFDATRGTLAAGDFDADGRTDIASLYDTGGGKRRLYTFISTGSGFADKRADWEGYVSEARPTVHVDPNRRYRIHPVHSNKCFDVPGGSTANDAILDQWDCVTTATWETFRFERVGGSPYYLIRTAADKCLDIAGYSLLDNAHTLQYACYEAGAAKSNQQFRLDLVAGGGYEPVVQLRVVHSEKCLRVSGASIANGARIVQAPCAAVPPSDQRFALRLEP
ncbi:RICIN domain-containing protein [Plantactinospora mayteni]|uniref:RICIN domain-containing protein n=1 Tax=Plantactinospora mayteni TaxID=566021 RepID=UPI0019453F6C|nr:RICIN domain-containing protein [Plantactinospora mayteni]